MMLRIFCLVPRSVFVLFVILFMEKPGFSQTAEKPKNRPAVSANQSAALKQLIADAEIALKLKPFSVTDNDPVPLSGSKNDFYSWAPYLWPNPSTKDGFPYINKDGKTNPETESRSDKPLLRKMAVAIQTLALAHFYSGEAKYSQHALQMIRTWFLDAKTKMNPNMNFGQCTPGVEKGTATGIIDSRWLILVTDAANTLKASGALDKDTEVALKEWFKNYLNWLLTSAIGIEEGKRNNNHASWYAAQAANFAIFTDQKPLAATIISDSKRFFDVQIDSLGRQKMELSRTKSFDYSMYNLHALMMLAEFGEEVSVDLWHYNPQKGSKKNIQESIRFMAAYASAETQWPFQQIADRVISIGYVDGDHFSVYYPYDLYSALLKGFEVYKDPVMQDAINKIPQAKREINRAVLGR